MGWDISLRGELLISDCRLLIVDRGLLIELSGFQSAIRTQQSALHINF
jgi:hypothetical protein